MAKKGSGILAPAVALLAGLAFGVLFGDQIKGAFGALVAMVSPPAPAPVATATYATPITPFN